MKTTFDPQMFLDPSPIVILGMQRSGNSAVAGALSRLGVDLGSDKDHFTAEVNSQTGTFELRSLSAFNIKCLVFFQMSVASTRRLPTNWQSYPQGRILVDELKALLVKHFSRSSLWGFKQPLASLVWPIYELAMSELGLAPQFVICVRNPLEIRASESSWVHVTGGRQIIPLADKTLAAWMQNTFAALNASQHSPYTVVPYADFLVEPTLFLDQIIRQRTGWDPSGEDRVLAIASVRTDLRNHSVPVDEMSDSPLLAKRLLQFCSKSPDNEETFASLFNEFEHWQSMLAPEPLSGTRIGLAWIERGETKSSQVPFLPSGDWQTVQIEVGAPPLTRINGLLYNKPCRVWIRRSEFVAASGRSIARIAPGPGSHLTEINGFWRLEGAYEAQQLNLVSPSGPGPYMLEMEVLLEAGSQISQDAAARLADRLHQCNARKLAIERQGGEAS